MFKIKLLVVGTLLFLITNAFAQQEKPVPNSSAISAGIETAFPIGSFANFSSFGIGVSVKSAFTISTSSYLTLSAGYISYSGKNNGRSLHFIPLKGGLRFNLSETYYAEPQIGYTSVSSKGYQTEGAFTYAFNLGFWIAKQYDIAPRFEAITKNGITRSFVGFRLAYNY